MLSSSYREIGIEGDVTDEAAAKLGDLGLEALAASELKVSVMEFAHQKVSPPACPPLESLYQMCR